MTTAKERQVRILVTGGAGFIGSHLAERLVADGHDVTALDNLSTGRRCNLASLAASARFRFVEADAVDPLPDVGRPERIYHLASPVARHLQHPIATLRANAEGTRRVLELAEAAGATVLLASTSEVYGDPAVHPQPETYLGNVSSTGPRSSYDEGKRYAEALAMAFRRERGARVRIARIFNTYGPRMRPDDGRVMPTFIARALAGRPVPVAGTGSQTRTFCYVADLVDGLVRLAESEHEGPVNLGGTDEITILDLARRIVEMTASAGRIEFVPRPTDDPSRRRPDLSLAGRLLGWRPLVSLDEGLRRTIAYYRTEEPRDSGRS
jgi:nucleoside-diphosphate-sugar epimerase